VANFGQGQQERFQPAKSKNTKLDAKHLVKCIAVLDQFQGLTKEEIRINFIQNGGQQPPLAQQQSGALKTNVPLTGQPAFGSNNPPGTQTQGNNLFGNNAAFPNKLTTSFTVNTQGTSLFGANQQQGTGILGQASNSPSLFGATQPNSLFGATTAQPNTLFGAQTTNPGTSLFGQTQQTSSMLGQQAPTSLFGQTNPSTGFLSNTQGQTSSLFNTASPLSAPPSLFNTGNTPGNSGQPSMFNSASPNLFGTNTAQPNQCNFSQLGGLPNQIGQPAASNNAFNQLMAPFFQPQQQPLSEQTQLLLPQLLLSYVLAQQPAV
jgi:hypothetical protein